MVHGHHQDADTVDVEALHGLVQVQDVHPQRRVVQHPVIPACVFSATRLVVQEGVRHARIDNLVDGNALRILQDCGQGFHMVLVRV